MRSLKDYFKEKDQGDENSSEITARDLDDKTIFHVFNVVIGENYGSQGQKNIIPTLYRSNTLFVSFKSSLWAQEVWIQRRMLLRKMEEKLGVGVVVHIKTAQ